jgi:MFS family permease
MSGVTFVAPLIGAWLAFLFCGPLADHIYARGYSKEGAKPKPEQRLPILFLSGTLGVAGLILFGVCTEDKCHYIAPLIGSALSKYI